MVNTLFLQSDATDPYEIYSQMLTEHPVFWDNRNKLWAIYSYENCKAILTNAAVIIPSLAFAGNNKLNEYAALLANNLTRLSNPPQHNVAKQISLQLFEKMKPVSLTDILKELFTKTDIHGEVDWVNAVCKKLLVFTILKGFDFADADIDLVLSRMEQLVKIMLPVKTDEQAGVINKIAKDIYLLVERNIVNRDFLHSIVCSEDNAANKDDILVLCVCNFIGLLIQSYDAGRGALSNSLLQFLLNRDSGEININDENYFYYSVVESLRFDPPVHNTKRILADDIFINGCQFRKGDAVLVIIAAANRDSQKFIKPNQYNIYRTNNNEHLTFSAGHHSCLAKYFS